MKQSRSLNKQTKMIFSLQTEHFESKWQKPTKSGFSKGDAVVGSCEQGVQGMKNLAFRHDWILCLTSVRQTLVFSAFESAFLYINFILSGFVPIVSKNGHQVYVQAI